MRIAIVHSFYSSNQPSGENRVVESQVAALREAGHIVKLVRRDTDSLSGPLYSYETALRLTLGTGFDPTQQLTSFQPDVVHIHNLFPNFGTKWIKNWKAPVLISLHNYRLFCSNGLFYRNGSICTECPDVGHRKALVHGCYKDSRLATLPVALSRQSSRKNILKHASGIVVTSELSSDVIHQFVAEPVRTFFLPNFVDQPRHEALNAEHAGYWLAMGRFSAEKGFLELVADWPTDERLVLDGFGPQYQDLVSIAASKNIEVRSSKSRRDLESTIRGAIALVFPSRWFDVDPQVVAEAMSEGLPVVTFYENAAARLVADTGTGAVYNNAATLQESLNLVRASRRQMSEASRSLFSQRWAKEAWLGRVESIYTELLANSQ